MFYIRNTADTRAGQIMQLSAQYGMPLDDHLQFTGVSDGSFCEVAGRYRLVGFQFTVKTKHPIGTFWHQVPVSLNSHKKHSKIMLSSTPSFYIQYNNFKPCLLSGSFEGSNAVPLQVNSLLCLRAFYTRDGPSVICRMTSRIKT